jgi:hypothetical protein
MSLAAGTVPMEIALVVAVVAFLGWIPLAARRPPEATAAVAAPVESQVTPPVASPPVTVRAVVVPQYFVAAPDEAAVRAALMRRLRPPVPLPVEVQPVPAAVPFGLPRSA